MNILCFIGKHKYIIIEKFKINYTTGYSVNGIKYKCSICNKLKCHIVNNDNPDIIQHDSILYTFYATHQEAIIDNSFKRNYNISDILK